MRQWQTRSENRIWSWLRDRRFCGYKFRRQHVIGGYIVDFYCAELRLVIEIDGKQHKDPRVAELDTVRTADLNALRIHVLRISNELIRSNYLTAIDCIAAAIRELEP